MRTAPLAPAVAAHRGPLERARREWASTAIMDRHHPIWARNPAETCPFCAYASLRADAASIALDMAVAEAHPAPDWRAFQDAVWEGRLVDTLRSEVA